jgi:hypothetical protein
MSQLILHHYPSSPFAEKDVTVRARASTPAIKERLRLLNLEICIGAKE